MDLAVIKTAVTAPVTRSVGMTLLKVQKFSPQILLGVGIAGLVGTVVLAARATLHLEEAVYETAEDLELVKDTEYETGKRDGKGIAVVYAKAGLRFGKLYGPATLLGLASISAIVGGHGILMSRNAGLIAAYTLLDESYKTYRGRVREELGEDKDKRFFGGIIEDRVEYEDADGKTHRRTTVTVDNVNEGTSIYAKWFDETSPNWCDSKLYNMTFLKGVQNMANDKLHSQGYLFLNEVYEMLGIPRTKPGQVVGWVSGVRGKDDFVDFGLYDPESRGARDFVNGYEKNILLDFNVDGVIWDLM